MRYVLAIVCPPIAVLLCGKPFQAVLNLILTLCFWIPGVVHALFEVNSHEDRKQFEILVESDDYLEKIVQDCAEMWRSKLRRCYPDSILCRQMFLSRSVVIAAQHGVKTGCGGLIASAFALYVCDRVEQRVSEMDREEAL